ncbi:uncharacterized protein [Lepeophtheirus salmonis]|uniref:uncharacterized protein n=1 Tax=Lepeophtheirus salmonis TaxID=72036 RepID=UPI001AE9C67A|nr:broad-complex core protein isoforms 1/2/3/4/5-like [Lepeophtheirus salmonis]
MGSVERFHVRWNEYESNIKNEFSVLRQNGDFFDVTLVCGSDQIKAHKVILSAFSPLLCSIIKSVPHEHPLVYLRGIKFQHLESLLYFMYNGEVSLTEDEFEDFLSTAFELEIRGLIQPHSTSRIKESSSSTSPMVPINEKEESFSVPPPEDKSLKEASLPQTPTERSRDIPIPSTHFLSAVPSCLASGDDDDDFQEDLSISERRKRRKRSKMDVVAKINLDTQEKENSYVNCDTEPNIIVEEVIGDHNELEAIPGTSSEHDEDLDMDFEYYKQNKVVTEDCGGSCLSDL